MACVLLLLLPAILAAGEEAPAQSAVSRSSSTAPPAIVIGFVGGWVHYNNMVHSEVQLAAKLRAEYPAGVYVQTFENNRPKRAYAEILRLLDTDRNGTLSRQEKQAARIILYGHSWGASEAVTLARRLQEDGIPVLLTIEVDSIRKLGEDDAVIPANVAEAVNFYQPHGMFRGRREIRAADPARTKILGNFQFDYANKPLACADYSWWDRHLAKPHTEIECDPAVWARAEALIRSELPRNELPPVQSTGTPR